MFEDISSLSSTQSFSSVASRSLDVLVDYDGAHDFNSLKMLALRPAKVQATWLGFAGTSGSKKIFDYIIVDKRVVPPEHAGN